MNLLVQKITTLQKLFQNNLLFEVYYTKFSSHVCIYSSIKQILLFTVIYTTINLCTTLWQLPIIFPVIDILLVVYFCVTDKQIASAMCIAHHLSVYVT